MDNDFVNTLLFLEEIQMKDQAEKTKFFSELTAKLEDFPSKLCSFKILPQLLNAYEFGNAGSSVLAPLFKLGKVMDAAEYQKKIVPIVVKLFSSPDRNTRMRLLQQMNLFVEHLSSAVLNEQIFPNLCNGFSDSNPAIREGTIRCIVLLAPKLSYNNMNVELMKHFARLQGSDDQGMIRTNATVCIGKIANYINPQLRQRILLSAFPKAMRDPFPLARISGIIALANTDRFYTLKDIATKVMPSLCMAAIDPEKDVRDEAFKTIKFFMQKLEKVSENPEQALEMEKDVSSCALELKNETSWTSWAMTGLSAKMTGYKNKNQQPSVALNTQPLGPPPQLVIPSDTKVPNKNPSPQSQKTTQKEEALSTTTTLTTATTIVKSNNFESTTTAWNLDDDDTVWKDLDDDGDQMEPLESNISSSYLSQSTANANNVKSSANANNADWSGWTNDFEENTLAGKNKSNNNSQSKLPLTSSYQWSSAQNEEDMFASLVKDIKITNKSPKFQTTNTAAVASSGWSNDWSDIIDDSHSKSNSAKQRIPQSTDRQQRNIEKQAENEKLKQSKPLKLGQKKDPIF
jgi:SCY1-like protein 1